MKIELNSNLHIQSNKTEELIFENNDYFSEFSIAEGLGNRGMGGIACNVLLLLARFFAPRRSQPGEVYSPAVDREEGIPDEVYTLW